MTRSIYCYAAAVAAVVVLLYAQQLHKDFDLVMYSLKLTLRLKLHLLICCMNRKKIVN